MIKYIFVGTIGVAGRKETKIEMVPVVVVAGVLLVVYGPAEIKI